MHGRIINRPKGIKLNCCYLPCLHARQLAYVLELITKLTGINRRIACQVYCMQKGNEIMNNKYVVELFNISSVKITMQLHTAMPRYKKSSQAQSC